MSLLPKLAKHTTSRQGAHWKKNAKIKVQSGIKNAYLTSPYALAYNRQMSNKNNEKDWWMIS